MTWQPIETAPKDQSDFLIFTHRTKDGERIFGGHQIAAIRLSGDVRNAVTGRRIRQHKWFDGFKHHYEDAIVGWQPLPPAPEETP